MACRAQPLLFYYFIKGFMEKIAVTPQYYIEANDLELVFKFDQCLLLKFRMITECL